MYMKRLMSFVLAFILVVSLMISTFSVSAADFGCNVVTSSKSIYMENLDTGTVVYEKNADEKLPPASLTKMMTYIVVCENVPDLENTMITVTDEMLAGLDPESSVMGLTSCIGEQVSVLDLLYGLMIPSGNDAALVLANYVGDGSVQTFVDMMNSKSGQLSCNSTHFVNPHGLYDPNHYSTARDLAVISKYAAEKPYFTEIESKVSHTVSSVNLSLETTNYMIDPSYPKYYYEYVEGGKTGYTDEAGKCLSSTAKKDEYRYMCIALGAPYSFTEDVNYAMLDTKEMYEWAFDNISYVELLPAQLVVNELSVEYKWGSVFVEAVTKEEVKALLPAGYDESLITSKVELPDYVSAPIEQGEVLGEAFVYYDGEFVGRTDIVSAENIERDESNYNMHRFISFVVENAILLAVIAAVLVVVIVFMVSSYKNRKRRNERRRYR